MRRLVLPTTVASVAVGLALLFGGCDVSDLGLGDGGSVVAPAFLTIHMTSEGPTTDPDGVSIYLDCCPQHQEWLPLPLPVTRRTNIRSGDQYSVTLEAESLAPWCQVLGQSARTVQLPPYGEGEIDFRIRCSDELGDLLAYTGLIDAFVTRPDGTRATRLLMTWGAESPMSGVTWRPDGDRIATSTASSGRRWDISSVAFDGTEQLWLTDDLDFDARSPSWSVNGDIAFIGAVVDDDCEPDPCNELYVMDGQGGSYRRLTDGAQIGHPSWSDDGTQLAFYGSIAAQTGIFVIGADGTGLNQITNDPSDRDPAWSPDGSAIAFSRDGDIHLLSPDGTGVRSLTEGEEIDRDPAWAPDGLRIAFLRGDTEKEPCCFTEYELRHPLAIMVMNADGTGQVEVTPTLRQYSLLGESAPVRWLDDGGSLAWRPR